MDTPSLIEEQSQYILDNIRDIIFTLSSDGIITSINQEFENATGWSRDEWIGKHFLEIVHPDDTAVVIEGFEATIRGETLPPYEARIIAKSGKSLLLEAKPTPQIVNGQVRGYLGIARDITERKQADESLRASEQQYRTMINSMGDPIHVIDKDFNIILANPAFSLWLSQLGLEIQLVGKPLRVAFPFLQDNIIDEYHTIFSSGQPLLTEEETTINGKTYFTETRKIPIIRNKSVVQVLTIIRDITKRKKIEEQLLESEKKDRNLISNITDVVAEVDAEGKFIFVSPQTGDLFGYHPEEMIGKKSFDFIHPDDRENALKRLEEALAGERIFNFEYRVKDKKGHYIWVATSGKASQHDHLKLVCVIRNITDQKRMEEVVRESDERLRSFMDGATDSFSLFDSELNLIDVNKTGLNTFLPGIKKTEVLGRNIIEFHTDPEDIHRYKEVLKTEIPFIAERVASPQNYGNMILSVKAFKVGDGLGIVAADITDRKNMENALRKSEERLRSFMDAATDSFSIWDSEFNLIDVNKTGLGKLPVGTSKRDIIGRNIDSFATYVRNVDKYKNVLTTGEPYIADRIFHHPSLGARNESVKAFKVEEGLGLITTDITERKQAEEELRKTKFRLEYLLKSCPAVIYSCTPDGHFSTTFMSENIKEILGFQARSFIDTPEFWESKLHPNDKEHVSTTFLNIQDQGYYSGAYRFKHKNGSYRWMLDEANLIKDKKGDPLEIVGFWTDITEYKKTEEALRESEEKFRSIFENSPIGMALADLNFGFAEVNAVFSKMLGYKENELTQMTVLDITHEEHRERDKEHVKKLLSSEISSFQTEKRYLKRNQEVLWVRVTLSLLHDDKGDPLNFLLMVEDITAIKQREEEVKKQSLKYNVENGNIYLITEEAPTLSKTVFNDLIDVGYKGLVISKTPERNFKVYMEGEYDFFWITEKNGYKELLTRVEETPSKSVILIDRLEYFFLKEGFENVMQFVYKLREITYLKNLVVILSIDSATISEREQRILEKETRQIEPRFMAKIAEEFLEILRFVYQQNNLGSKPSYSRIGEELQISRPTVRKRVKQLIVTGYLLEHKKGKSKIIEISGKGRMLFLS